MKPPKIKHISKKDSISGLKKKVDVVFKKFIRTRDKKCVHCGRTDNLQASHAIPISHGNRLRYDERNVKTLCYHCHLNWWHKNPIEAGDWFKNTFPEDHAYLESVKNETKKFTIDELQGFIEKYTELLTVLEETK